MAHPVTAPQMRIQQLSDREQLVPAMLKTERLRLALKRYSDR
jgi:hypothetical protein